MTVIKFNDVLAKDEVIIAHKVIKSSKSPLSILIWEGLQHADYEGLLPKGYIKRVRNGHISPVTAKKFLNKLYKEGKMTVSFAIKPIPNQTNKYVVAVTTKVA